jgi:tetratricopeptide (TPR) repeat protein
MQANLDFSIPSKENSRNRSSLKWVYIILILLVILSIFNAMLFFVRPISTTARGDGPAPSAEAIKALALKLEKQELTSQAISAWKEYLTVAEPDTNETARIWYRIGKISETKGDYDSALDAYYRSEAFASPEDIRNEINLGIQRCLEKAGRFAALRYELQERVGEKSESVKGETPQNEKGQAVAEIGAMKITREELDKKIEKAIASRINGLSRYLSPDRINKEKENLLKEYSSENSRRMFLEQYLIEEMLYRKAREDRLAETDEVREALKNMERSILASKVLENAYKNEIKVTESDVRNYYEANKTRYKEKDKDGKEQVPEFDKVKDRVVIDLMSEKERDVQSALIGRLKEKYNVVEHNSAMAGGEAKPDLTKKDK